MGLYVHVAKEISQAVHWDGSVATYTKGPWSYMYLRHKHRHSIFILRRIHVYIT